MPKRPKNRGYCKFYIDGTSDYESGRKKRDSGSSESGGSKEGPGKPHDHGHSHEHPPKGPHHHMKKKPNTKCYDYEDGSKDDGAVLNKGVKYTFYVTREDGVIVTTTPKPEPAELEKGYCLFYIDGTTDVVSGRKKRAAKKVFNRIKKKKDVKCYEYEDGTKDEGAVLKEGVKYTVTVTKEVIE
ncbi:hypothetical protein CAEBREN_24967 [Caenorhabditis brenneri]|uniref:Uncharacterized protein n=1 Tax=Caenorhabditis brenneri TaxID=135651 RepID=G0MP32_CAEBE|nr:hypothetical protein CAEBREN_24967 [Caenorhabditis brenneri]